MSILRELKEDTCRPIIYPDSSTEQFLSSPNVTVWPPIDFHRSTRGRETQRPNIWKPPAIPVSFPGSPAPPLGPFVPPPKINKSSPSPKFVVVSSVRRPYPKPIGTPKIPLTKQQLAFRAIITSPPPTRDLQRVVLTGKLDDVKLKYGLDSLFKIKLFSQALPETKTKLNPESPEFIPQVNEMTQLQTESFEEMEMLIKED